MLTNVSRYHRHLAILICILYIISLIFELNLLKSANIHCDSREQLFLINYFSSSKKADQKQNHFKYFVWCILFCNWAVASYSIYCIFSFSLGFFFVDITSFRLNSMNNNVKNNVRIKVKYNIQLHFHVNK